MSYSHEWGVQRQFLAPPPEALGRGQKVKYHLISITKSISKIFIPNFVFVLTNERLITYIRWDFHSVAWVMPKGWDFGVLGVPRWSKFIFFNHGHVAYQIEEDDKQNRMQVNFYPRVKLLTLGWGQRSNTIKFRLPCQCQRFLYQTLCVFVTNARYKTYQMGFSFCRLGHAPGVGLRGTGGAQWVKPFFFQTWSCGISSRRGWRAEQNASNIFILGSNWWPWGKVKRSNIISLSISKIFIPNFVCVLTNKR